MYAGSTQGSDDENRLIMQSNDGSTRLVEVNHMRQFGAASDQPQPSHIITQLWVPPSSVTPQDQRLVVAHTHLKMVKLYSDMLVAAMAQHHETTDQWSFESDPLTGAMTCAAAMPPMGDADASGHTNRLPSSLSDEDSRPHPPIEAHVEPQDRCSFTALSDVPDGLSPTPRRTTRRPPAAQTGNYGRPPAWPR